MSRSQQERTAFDRSVPVSIWNRSRPRLEAHSAIPLSQPNACTTDTFSGTLSDAQILDLNTYDFMAYLGKNVINPGGTRGRDQILETLDPPPGARILEIGCGTGHTACHIAQRYRSHVTAIDISPGMIEGARQRVRTEGLHRRVECHVADIAQLPFNTASFDYVICQAVLMFVDKQRALSEIRRVLCHGGSFGGLEFGWKRPPTDNVRDTTYQICGCRTLEFHSASEWADLFQRAGLSQVESSEQPFDMLSVSGFLRDEGVGNSIRIFERMLKRKATLKRMQQIWQHFSAHRQYFSYTVISARNIALA